MSLHSTETIPTLRQLAQPKEPVVLAPTEYDYWLRVFAAAYLSRTQGEDRGLAIHDSIICAIEMCGKLGIKKPEEKS